MLQVVYFPAWLTPEIFPGFPLRWYGLMYIAAFAVSFVLYRRQVKERNFPISDDDLSGMFFAAILGLLLGARIFSTIIYDTSGIYRSAPWLVFWPFRGGAFTGLQGMSYHGGVFACFLAIFLYSKRKGFNFREVCDMFAASAPLGFTFGRLGNFANAELYGRVTGSSFGMIFPNAAQLPTSEGWVQEMAQAAGIAITGPWVNLPRHPSQLYQAFFEGLVLWAIIWFFRNRKPFKGFLVGLYFAGYGFFRFFVEYFRQPDANLGFRLELGAVRGLPVSYAHPFLSFTTGQILSFLMIVFAGVWLFVTSRLPDSRPVVRVYTGEEDDKPDYSETPAQRNKRRKMRKKLK
ncbi:MAG: prolipoprotein diacylglyceryl transferase [Spirochaetes bacterium]|nr:prolipoprotein diacylglyceryl transferase [Spirochaetota bacterium]